MPEKLSVLSIVALLFVAVMAYSQFYSTMPAGAPTGAIVFTSDAGCPADWTVYAPLRGRTAVGLVSGGTLEGSAGTALTDLESRATGQHWHIISSHPHVHSVTGDSHMHSIALGTSGIGVTLASGGVNSPVATWSLTSSTNNINATLAANTTGASLASFGGEIIAPYIQLTPCRKN